MTFDVDKAVAHLNAHAKLNSAAHCAKSVRLAVHAGGVMLPPTKHAKDYGPGLKSSGFSEVLPTPSTYEAGDVVVIQPASGHPSGHMAMYNGSQWVSDFKQKNGLYPGDVYRKEQPDYKIYRYSE